MATEIEIRKPAELSVVGPELRLLDRRAFVGFPSLNVSPGVVISDFALQIPEVSFPFNFTGGAARYQKKRLAFGFLELTVDSEVISRHVHTLSERVAELQDLKLHFRPGYLEGQARLKVGERPALTFKVAFDGDADRLAVYLYDVRFYGYSPIAAPQLPVLIARSVEELGALPELELRGATGFTSRVLPPLVQLAAVSRGYKMPALDQARLAAAEVSAQGLRLRFAAGGLPPPAPPDEELLLALEGSRAFADAEALIAQGKLTEAREAYLRSGDAHEAHPFAAERLLTLLVADPQAHEMALDIAASLSRRRERSAAALWTEAVVRERRGEHARAAERYLALCALSRKNQEEAAAFFAAESAARAARDQAPQMAVKALHELLGLRPDHLPSLKQLARAADQAKDRAGAIRAYRRIAALARDPGDAAEAHVHMARLSAQTEDDVAGARLHCEAALRLTPDHPDALFLLGDLCFRADEHLRAIKSLDRLREVALGRHDVDRVGKANLLAGKVWEVGLKQPENALLRYREAISLLPGEPEPLFYAARVAEGLGKLQEALSGYQQTIELAGPSPRTEEIRFAAHQSHHALSRLTRTRLGDPAKAREHLESALALDPRDMAALEELIPFFRASGRAADLADACEKAAAITEAPIKRAAYWAEAGELFRGRLGKPEKAEKLLLSALEADPNNRLSLEGMLALAESRRDGALLCRCLKALAELSQDKADRARYFRRLSVAARDLAFDLELAAYALTEVLKLEPEDLPALGELCGLQRKRADMTGLAAALDQRSKVAEQHGDKRLAAAALRELAQVLEVRLGRVGEALVALERAARLSPDAAVLLDLADLSLRCERPQHARRALEDLLATLPRHTAPERMAEIRVRLGKACDALGDREAAKDHYAQAFPLRRLDDELAARLEALYEQDGQLRELTDLWAARAQALVVADRSGDAAPLFLAAARTLLRQKERDAAILRLTSALDAAPEGPHAGEVLELMADLELERGQKLEAAKLLARRAGLLKEVRPAARLYARAARLALGTPREQGFLEQALGRDPSYAPARMRQAELVADADPRAALEHLEAALAASSLDGDAPAELERLELTKRAALAAVKAGRTDTARKHLALYSAQRPEDLEAQRELANLHRRAGAREALCDLLGELWPRVAGNEKRAALKEYAELCQQLSRPSAALDALRSLRDEDPQDLWAVRALLAQLPSEELGTPVELEERLSLLSALGAGAQGDERAQLLARRAQLLRRLSRLGEARADLAEAARLAARPGPLLLELADAAREASDEVGELAAWRTAVSKDPSLAERASARVLALARSRLGAADYGAARAGFLAATGLPLSEDDRCDAFLGLAEAAFGMDDAQAGLAALWDASQQGPPARRVQALLRRAAALEERGDTGAAIESYEEVRRLSSRDGVATAGLKRLLRAGSRWQALAELLSEEAVTVAGAVAARLYEELGDLHLDRLAQPRPAEAAYRRAAALDRANAHVRRRLAGLLADRGELEDAGALLEETADVVSAAEAGELLREGARRAQLAGALDLGLRLARRAHALKPARGDDLVLLVELLYLRGELREALPLQQQLAQDVDFDRDPVAAEAVLLRLADLAERNEEPQLAEQTYRDVLAVRPLCKLAVERLSALVAQDSPREGLEILAAYAQKLPPSPESSGLLTDLAARAKDRLADTELAARLMESAIAGAEDPASVRRALVSLYRDAGRTQELGAQLRALAELALSRDDLQGAIDAYSEEATLAEQTGRVDDALRTLARLRDLCEAREQLPSAALLERRRAELLRDAKVDLDGAETALRRSLELDRQRDTALLGLSLSRQRADPPSEAVWLERLLDLQTDRSQRARTLLELAELQRGPLHAPAQAEAAAREALRYDPQLASAQALLTELLTAEGRFTELAAHFEELAAVATDRQDRALLYKRAAALYREHGQVDAAAAALLAARAVTPDDAELTGQTADLLSAASRPSEAAELDALLLEADPFREPSFGRHLAYLKAAAALQDVAALLLARARVQQGAAAAESYLGAAAAFQEAGAAERAQLCEDQAFEQDPSNATAFEALRRRRAQDVRRLSDLLAARARAVPAEAPALLRERAHGLAQAGEALLAADAFDELLHVAGDDAQALMARAELAAAAGGPQAAQPYDRRLLSGGHDLPPAVRTRAQLRLGHAALAANALQDAADAFEAVVAQDGGERGREALSLLAEVYERTRNAAGLLRTTLALAQSARPDEAEALYRRASELFEDPREVIDALLPLARLRPMDGRVVDRAVQGLLALGRHPEAVELYERSAQAQGGGEAAERLLAAAALAETQLNDAPRAYRLLVHAVGAAPGHPGALRALLSAQRLRQDRAGMVSTLKALLEVSGEVEEAALWRLELAQSALEEADESAARTALEAVVARGPAGSGYSEALVLLQPLLKPGKDDAALGALLAARGELAQGEERAALQLDGARAFERAGDAQAAAALCRASLASRPTAEALLLLGGLWTQLGQPAKAAAALVQAAQLSAPEKRGELLLRAADAWETAGELPEARDLLERVAQEHGELFPVAERVARFTRLSAFELACRYGFDELLGAGDLAGALLLADQARDRGRQLRALWALTRRGDAGHAHRLANELRREGDADGLLKLAQACEEGAARPLAVVLFEELALSEAPLQVRELALTRRFALGDAAPVLALALEGLTPASPQVLVELCLVQARLEGGGVRAAALQRAAELLPARSGALLRELYEHQRDGGAVSEAAATLAQLADDAQDPKARAALRVELGELFLRALSDEAQARAAFERALVEDAGALRAVQALATLYAVPEQAERFVAMTERLNQLAGPAALAPHLPRLVDALEALGRKADALDLLATLEESPERLERRAQLAEELGRRVDALTLRERLATTAAERVRILKGYLDAQLHPLAVKLAQRLLAEGALPPEARRPVAERLSGSLEGAALARGLWPALLREHPLDVDGWTLFAEALRKDGRAADSQWVDAFGAALSGSTVASGARVARPVRRAAWAGPSLPVPAGAVELSEAKMPRLSRALFDALEALGAQGVSVHLDVTGGPTASLLAADRLLLGAGALGAFGAGELSYLVALVLALGPASRELLTGAAGLTEAAVEAFEAVPSALAAGRVLVVVESNARGLLAPVARPVELLSRSEPFLAIVQRALAAL